jgi:tight adherence protein C
MLLLLGCLFLGLAAFVAAEIRTLPARQRREVVRRAATYGVLSLPGTAARNRKASSGRLVTPLVALAATCLLRLMPRTTRDTVTERLLRAGLANRLTADELVAAKGLLALLAGVFGGVIGAAAGGPVAGFLFALSFAAIGLLALDFYVNSKFSQRRESIQAALPDAIDLLAVTVEAGLGFDGALAKLTDHMEGPLAEEFALALNEMRIGESRVDALKRMAARVDVRELSSFVRAVVQADQLGMSMGAMLRVQAADVRVRRQLAAEEKAMKMPIKMVFPLVFFILPAMFIVILGPFFLSFRETF